MTGANGACRPRFLRRLAAASLALLASLPAQAETRPGDVPLSPAAREARARGDDLADYMLLTETEACLAAHKGPGDCAELLVTLLERARSYHQFGYVPTGTTSYDGKPGFDYVQANSDRAAALGRIAAAHVAARYAPARPFLSIGAAAVPPSDAEARLALLARAYRWVSLEEYDMRADALIGNAIAVLLVELGRVEPAFQVLAGPGLIKPQAESLEAIFGPAAAETAILLNNNAAIDSERRGIFEVEAFRKAADILAATPGASEASMATVNLNLARALRQAGDGENAERLYQRWLPVLSGAVGRDDPRVAQAVVDRARVIANLGRGEEALALLDGARPADDGWIVAIEGDLARTDALLAAKRLAEAEKVLAGRVQTSIDAGASPPAPLAIAGAPDWFNQLLAGASTDHSQPGLPRRITREEKLLGEVHRRYARLLSDAGRNSEAVQPATTALRLNPDDLEALYLRAWLTGWDFLQTPQPDPMTTSAEEFRAASERRAALFADATSPLQTVVFRAGSESVPVAIEANLALGLLNLKSFFSLSAVDYFQRASSGARKRIDALHQYDVAERRELDRYRDVFRAEMVVDFLASGVLAQAGSARADGKTADDLVNDAYIAAQWAGQSSASGALANLAARFSRGTGPLAALERERQELARKSEAAERKLAALLGQPEGSVDAERDAAAAARDRLASELSALEARIAADDPAYADLTRPTALTIAETRALLAPEEALVLIVPASDATYVIAVSRETVEWTRAEAWGEKPLGEAIARLRAPLGGGPANRNTSLGGGRPATTAFDRKLANALYEGLLAPVAKTLAGKGRVMTVTHGALGELPLALLVTEPPSGADSDPAAMAGTRWLADRHALTTLPAVSSLKALRCLLVPVRPAPAACKGAAGRGDPALRNGLLLAGFGAPTLKGAPGADTRAPPYAAAFSGELADTAFLRKLAWLPGSLAELSAVARDFPQGSALVITGDAATEAEVKQSGALAEARYVIFSTHGLLASESGIAGEPGLVFTPPQESAKSETDDGLLTASEAAALRLQAELVVLSACNTAASDGSAGGEGLSGLARGFFYAGARALMVSHWPVSDAATSRLITGVFERLRAKEAPALALQNAIRELRADPKWASPEFWAPFVLVGTGS